MVLIYWFENTDRYMLDKTPASVFIKANIYYNIFVTYFYLNYHHAIYVFLLNHPAYYSLRFVHFYDGAQREELAKCISSFS